ncbi:MAG: hypothetical protein ACOH2N_09335 [Devosia sp.]
MTDNETADDKKSAIITIIGVASAVWLLVCVWLFWVAAPCDATQAGWYARNVSCLASNEMGDSLAGAFAPLAFLWLIAAVFLQRNELAAQRQELRESRAVAAQQVEEAKKNVDLIGIQTGILKDERAAKIEKDADEDLKELIETASKIFVDISRVFSVAVGPLDRNSQKQPYEPDDGVYSMAGPYVEPGVGRLGRISEQVLMISVSVLEAAQQGEEIRYSGFHGFERLITVLSMIDDVNTRVSAPTKAELMRVSAIENANVVKNLMKHLTEKAINMDEQDSPF